LLTKFRRDFQMLDAHERKREVGCTQKAFDLIRRVSGKTVCKMNDLRVQEEQVIEVEIMTKIST